MGGGAWLIEETSLASRPGSSDDELRRRLDHRLQALGVRVVEERGVERVQFPMETPMPRLDQPVVGLGAAAALVHPATGYSVASSLRAAPKMAAALTSVLGRSGATPLDASKAAWRAVWPAQRVRARALEQYGLERLLTLDQRDIRAFFDAFFGLPALTVSTYLDGEASAAELASAMRQVFRVMPRRLQCRLAAGNPFPVARALLAP